MPQIATYRVCVGVADSASLRPLISDPHTLVVPDIMSATAVETDLHEKMIREWVATRQAGTMFDLEKITSEESLAAGGRFAVNPDRIAWLNTELLSLEPAGQPTTPD